MITVRLAGPADVPAMSAVLVDSITSLCTADHRGDPAAIAAWTANKSETGVAAMLANPQGPMFVAERDGEIAAVGAVSRSGEVTLNYVAPSHRFSGVSKALLAGLEAALREAGVDEARLKSTATARRFYLAAGWLDEGPPASGRFIASYPMRKRL